LQIKFSIFGTRLVARVTGSFDADLSIKKFGSILSFCRIYSLDQVLIDFRDLGGVMYATVEIMYAHNISRLYQQHLTEGGEPLRIAYVGPETFVRNTMPGLGIAQAAGLDVLATSEFPEAVEWLELNGNDAS
jgi:hypothetical protein